MGFKDQSINKHSNIQIVNHTGINTDTQVLVDGARVKGVTGLIIDFGTPGDPTTVKATITAHVQALDVRAESSEESPRADASGGYQPVAANRDQFVNPPGSE